MYRMSRKIRMYLDLRIDHAPRLRPKRRDDGLEPAPVLPRPHQPMLSGGAEAPLD
jgi:hypothetical protein